MEEGVRMRAHKKEKGSRAPIRTSDRGAKGEVVEGAKRPRRVLSRRVEQLKLRLKVLLVDMVGEKGS